MRRAAGFTLIELLVAVTLVALIASLGTALMRVTLASDGRGAALLAEQEAVRDTVTALAGTWARRQGASFRQQGQRIEFQVDDGVGRIGDVAFECIREENGVLSLWRFSRAAGKGDPLAMRQKLLGGLRECRFGFMLPPAGSAASALWVDQWSPERPAPAVIRLDIESTRGVWPPLIVAAR